MELTNFESRQLPPSTTPEGVEEEELQGTNLTKSLSRLAFILVVLGCLFFIPSSKTEAQGGNRFYIHNHTSNTIVVAAKYYAYNRCRCWVTSGWWHIQPGQRHSVLYMGNQNTFFFNAHNAYGGWWGARDHDSWVSSRGFKVDERYIQSQGSGGMQSQGFRLRPFTRIYTGTSGQDFIWNLYP